MQIEFDQKTVSCRRESFRQTKLIQEHAECIVSDIYEDIGKIVFAKSQLFLKGKDLTAHGASVSVCADISVFYITEGLDRIRCISLSKDFSIDFDSDSIAADSILQVSFSPQGVQARAVNSRKIAVQFSAAAELVAWAADSFAVSVQIGANDQNGLELLEEKKDCLVTTDVTEKSFVISEQLPLQPDGETPTQIICAHAELSCSEQQMIGSKLLLKGGAAISFRYETVSGSVPGYAEQWVPFSVLIDSPGEDAEIGRILLQATALYVTLGEAVNGTQIVETELHAVAQISFQTRIETKYISDMYSTRFPLCCDSCIRTVCTGQSECRHIERAEDQSELDEKTYMTAAVEGEALSCVVRDGKAFASVIVSTVLKADDGSMTGVQKLLSLETPLPSGVCELLGTKVLSREARVEENRVVFSVEAAFDFLCLEYSDLNTVTAAELDEEREYNAAQTPALTLVLKNDHNVWELAKQYRSSMAAITELNEKFDLPENVLMIPQI
ncbi:MAG: hypothetical protein IJS79_06740 [Oscillospiraceae bacterium]|nr:hypothetical protein [Oscillospiraceae bacterium]